MIIVTSGLRMWQAPWKIPHKFLTDYWRNESRVKFCEISLNHLSGNLNFHFISTSGFLHCLKQPTWSWRIKLMYKLRRVAMRITLDKWEDEDQGLSQRVSSPPTDGFLSWKTERWYPLQHYRNPGNPQMNYTKVLRWMKTKNYIKRNIHLLEANFFSAFSSSFFQIISFVPKLPPHAIPGPITEVSWRSPDHSLLLPNCDAPAAPPLDVLVQWEMASSAGHGASSRCQLGYPMPTVQH